MAWTRLLLCMHCNRFSSSAPLSLPFVSPSLFYLVVNAAAKMFFSFASIITTEVLLLALVIPVSTQPVSLLNAVVDSLPLRLPSLFSLSSISDSSSATVLASTSSSSPPTPTFDPLPFNQNQPGPTPAYKRRPLPPNTPYSEVAYLRGATSGGDNFPPLPAASSSSTSQTAPALRFRRGTFGFPPLTVGNAAPPTPSPSTGSASQAPPRCIDSGNTEVQINALFSAGGAHTTVYLCAKATISVSNSIFFTAAYQVLTTQGNPTGTNRATILVTGASQTTAVTGTCSACNYVTLQSVIINGNRPVLGELENLSLSSCSRIDCVGPIGQYTINEGGNCEMGGNSVGQIIQNIFSFRKPFILSRVIHSRLTWNPLAFRTSRMDCFPCNRYVA